MATTDTGWLPPAQDPPDLRRLPPWEPASVAEMLVPDGRWDLLRYVVVDELHEGVAGLVVTPWPRVDVKGRLRFVDEDACTRVATVATALRKLLVEHRRPIVPVDVDPLAELQLRRRSLQVGDVFAARTGPPPGRPGGGGPGGELLADPADVLDGEVLDITAEAREVTKVQATAAASGVMDEALLIAIAEELGEDEEPPEHEPEPDPESSPPQPPSGQAAAQPPTAAAASSAAAPRLEMDLAEDIGLGQEVELADPALQEEVDRLAGELFHPAGEEDEHHGEAEATA